MNDTPTPAPLTLWAVLNADGTSLFVRSANGYRYAQVFMTEKEAIECAAKYRKMFPNTIKLDPVVRIIKLVEGTGEV